jgi:hypothetical protein
MVVSFLGGHLGDVVRRDRDTTLSGRSLLDIHVKRRRAKALKLLSGGWGSVGKGAFDRRHLRNSGRLGYGDRWVTCTGKPADVNDGGGSAAAATLLGFQARERWCVCVCVRAEFFGCVCGGGGKVVSEEMMRVLKILLGGSKMPGLLKIWMKGLSNTHRTRSKHNNRVLSNRKTLQAARYF